MFLSNKYTKWYHQIIDKRKDLNREKGLDIYLENHHIIPTSMGGKDDKSNLILLTAKEHFICHLLLIKMTSGDNKRSMTNAIIRFMGDNRKKYKMNSRIYQYLREENSKNMSGEGNPMYGKPWYFNSSQDKIDKWKKHISLGISGDKNPFYGKTHTEETRKILREKRSNKIIVYFSNNHIIKLDSQNKLGPHLNLSVSMGQKLCEAENFKKREKYNIDRILLNAN